MRSKTVLATYLFLLTLFAHAQLYKTTSLGTLGGDYSVDFAVNEHGQHTGQSRASNGQIHAFRWTKSGGMQDLGTLGGDFSSGQAINDSGDVIGDSHTGDNTFTHPFRWTATSGMQDLGSVLGGDSFAILLNNSGQVAGGSCSPDRSVCHAFLWSSDTGTVDLGTLGGINSSASALNDLGQVVGTADLSNGSHHAFVWSSSSGMHDLGALDTDSNSTAFAINNSGQVVGQSEGARLRAFRWTNANGMVFLGDLGGNFSSASLIDDTGRVAGESTLPGNDQIAHSFLWTQSGGIQDLGVPGTKPVSTFPLLMYKSGQIMNFLSTTKLFLWTPPTGKKTIPAMEFFGFNQPGQITGGKNNLAVVMTPVMQVNLRSSKNPAPVGSPVKFTAKVKFVLGAAPDREQVQFKDGNVMLGTAVLSKGIATFTTSDLGAGTHSITANYVGDEIYDPKSSKVISQVINP